MSTVILGGGISGLSAAFYLAKRGQKSVLLEASNRLGGWIKSNKLKDGVVFEEGPRTIRPHGVPGVNTLNLVEELGLGGHVVPITNYSPASRNRMVYVNGELHSLPNSLASLFKAQKPFSKPLIFYILQDLKNKPKLVQDESIYDFTERRFGSEVADYIISPLVRGICAGNSREISVNFLMDKLFNYEQKYGSISGGILRHFFDKKPVLERGHLAHRALKEKWNVYSFEGGMETFPKQLEIVITNSKNVNVLKNSLVSKLEFINEGLSVHFGNGQCDYYKHIVSSVSAKVLANLIKNQHPQLAELLNKIKSVTVAVVNLEFSENLIKSPGFGFLVPPKENLSVLGVIYDSCCHSYKNTVLTVMMGGYWFKELFGDNPNEDQLLSTALKDIKMTLNIDADPISYKVNILKDCIPQYVIGHQENLNNIETYIKKHNLPLYLCGSSYYGVGVNDVILSSKTAVKTIQ